jgi:hypothetical protein
MKLLSFLTGTKWSAAIFVALLAVMYGVLPLAVNLFFANPYFVELAQICAVTCIFIMLGFILPLFDSRFRPDALRLTINATAFHVVVWAAFILFLFITFATASSVPIISVFFGATADELSQQRGDFLKGRQGAEAALLYLSTLFVSALLPYSLVHLFIEKARLRYQLTLLFFGFSISFLQKALFVNVVFPLFYLFVRKMKAGSLRIALGVVGSLVLLYLITVLASGGQSEFDTGGGSGDFFASAYLPSSAIDLLVWRSIGVPVFTAADTLLVFEQQFGGKPLLGATSTFFATLFSLERIPLERLVFEHQWGWNDIANANAVFMIDAYVNFGWPGVVAFAFFVGQSLRWFHKSQDEAFKSLWLIYCFALFSGPLIGMLLSNGYVLMFTYALFVRLRKRRPTSAPRDSGV